MSSKDKEEGGAARVPGGGIFTDQTSVCEHNPPETIISVQDGDFNLSSGDLENLRSLDEAMEGDQIEATAKPLIQRVPSMLGGNKDFRKYFKPRVMAIGPLHHDDPSLQGAEKLKLKLAANFIKKHGVKKEILYNKIKMEIANLKKRYDPKELERYCDNDEKLTWIFFLDGCAILQAIYLRYAADDIGVKENHKDHNTPNEIMNIKNDLLTFVYLDLFLLENQLPYRVLKLLTSSSKHGEMFMKSIKKFIDDNVMTPAEIKQRWKQEQKQVKKQQQQQQGKQQKQLQEPEPTHLLELLRARLVVTKEKKRTTFQNHRDRVFKHILSYCNRERTTRSHHSHTFRNVKELRESGIWLKPSETSCLMDISFNRKCCVGKLKLPPITVDDSTGPKFMNLIAYEMCPDFDNDFTVTSYICFLDSLIDEAEDVKALRDAGILYNGLGSDEEVAKLFNKMNTDLVPSLSIYEEVKLQIHNHCRNMWINYAAQAYHTHFRSPWTFLAFVGAIAALLLSAIQTFYTIHPKN